MITLRKKNGAWEADVRVTLASGQVVRRRGEVDARSKDEARRWAEDREQAIRGILSAAFGERIRAGERLTNEEVRQALRTGAAPTTPEAPRPRTTVAQYVESWLAERRKRELASWRDDEARARLHVLPIVGAVPLDELRPHHVREMLRTLKEKASRRGGKLANRTIRSAYGVLRQALSDAVVDDLLPSSPCLVKKGDLPPPTDKVAGWRQQQDFEAGEVAALVRDPRIPERRRVGYVLAFLTGMRPGELSARRWRDLDWEAKPLPRLLAATAWNTRERRERGTKTAVEHWIPIHPLLGDALTRWWLVGWEGEFGRSPRPSDFIVPAPLSPTAHRNVGVVLKLPEGPRDPRPAPEASLRLAELVLLDRDRERGPGGDRPADHPPKPEVRGGRVQATPDDVGRHVRGGGRDPAPRPGAPRSRGASWSRGGFARGVPRGIGGAERRKPRAGRGLVSCGGAIWSKADLLALTFGA